MFVVHTLKKLNDSYFDYIYYYYYKNQRVIYFYKIKFWRGCCKLIYWNGSKK